MTRACGECTLCCKLLPMSAQSRGHAAVERLVGEGLIEAGAAFGLIRDFDKPAGVRCPYQRHRKGCTVYAQRPFGCRTWFCRWLINDDAGDLARPDRAHYVIDEQPDFVTTAENDGQYPVLQVWVDPDYPDAHRDPALRAFLARRCQHDGFVGALVRYNNERALFLFQEPDGTWHERSTNMRTEGEHTAEEKWQAGLRPDQDDAGARLKQVFG